MKRSGPLPRYTALAPGGPLKNHKPIRKVSARRRRENRERRAMADRLWPGRRPRCVVPWCRELADDIHEPYTRGRGGPITDPNNSEPVCRGHNHELTKEPEWGYALDMIVHSWDPRSLAEQAADRRAKLAAWRPS